MLIPPGFRLFVGLPYSPLRESEAVSWLRDGAFMSLDVPSCPKRKGAPSLAIRSVNIPTPVAMEAVSSSSVVEPPPEATDERPRKQRKCELHVCMVEGCGKSFAWASRLARHIVIHSEARPYACKVEGCGKRFVHAATLLYHSRIHSGERPCVCTFNGCGMRFKHPTSLTVHSRAHTGDKPYACKADGCGVCYSTSSSLLQHSRTHTGDKPYACKVDGCGACFATSGSLTYHSHTHTGDRPYACKFDGCGFRCIQSSSLKMHTLRHHTERGIQRQKKREEQVARFLTDAGVAFERETTVSFCGEAKKKYARIDFTIYYDDRVVCLEVDEGQHTQYGIGCDAARMLNVLAQHVKRNPLPLHFIRYNPDAWTVNGTK